MSLLLNMLSNLQIEIDYAKLPAVKSFNIVASQNEKEEYITQLRKRHGDYITPETVEEEGLCFREI